MKTVTATGTRTINILPALLPRTVGKEKRASMIAVSPSMISDNSRRWERMIHREKENEMVNRIITPRLIPRRISHDRTSTPA